MWNIARWVAGVALVLWLLAAMGFTPAVVFFEELGVATDAGALLLQIRQRVDEVTLWLDRNVWIASIAALTLFATWRGMKRSIYEDEDER